MIPTSVDETQHIVIRDFVLHQNYPNPFNPTTLISYSIPEDGMVTLKVYDVLGREVGMLINGKESLGNYIVRFDGSQYASGVYFCRIEAGEYRAVKKLLLLK